MRKNQQPAPVLMPVKQQPMPKDIKRALGHYLKTANYGDRLWLLMKQAN